MITLGEMANPHVWVAFSAFYNSVLYYKKCTARSNHYCFCYHLCTWDLCKCRKGIIALPLDISPVFMKFE